MSADYAELVESVVALAGSADRASAWLRVTPSAVSAWRSGGGISDQSVAACRGVMVRWEMRLKYLRGWLRQRTTGRGGDFAIVIECHKGSALDERSSLGRSIYESMKVDREQVTRHLVSSYMDHEMIVDGDVLVFSCGDLTEMVYVDREDVAVSFTRKEWEPWPSLRPFVKKDQGGK